MSLRQLSERLGEIGHPMLPSGINKLENRKRRVDVGDLVALALALDVSPLALLMPAERRDVQLTPEVRAEWERGWRWAVGERPLTGEGWRFPGYIAANRPFERPLTVEMKLALLAREYGDGPSTLTVRHHGDGKAEAHYEAYAREINGGERQ